MKRDSIIVTGYRRLKELKAKEEFSFYDEGQVQGYVAALDELEATGQFWNSRAAIVEGLAGYIKDPRPPEHWSLIAGSSRKRAAYTMGYVHALQVMALLTRRVP